MNWAKLASEVEGEDLAAEGCSNLSLQHFCLDLQPSAWYSRSVARMGFEAMRSENLGEWQISSSSHLQTSDQLVPNVLVQETPFLE